MKFDWTIIRLLSNQIGRCIHNVCSGKAKTQELPSLDKVQF